VPHFNFGQNSIQLTFLQRFSKDEPRAILEKPAGIIVSGFGQENEPGYPAANSLEKFDPTQAGEADAAKHSIERHALDHIRRFFRSIGGHNPVAPRT